MKRLLSIDIFRGITIFFMILVNTQAGGSFDFLNPYPWLSMENCRSSLPIIYFYHGSIYVFIHAKICRGTSNRSL